jgi:hypothetical protein
MTPPLSSRDRGGGLRTLLLLLALALALVLATAAACAASTSRSTVRNGPLTLFLAPENGIARIVTVGGRKQTTIWHCPRKVFCGMSVSFAWAPSGRRVAFTLTELGGKSTYVGFHIVNVVSGRDTRVPPGAPKTATITDWAAWETYLQKEQHRVGCNPEELAWSPRGTRLAYSCETSTSGADLDVLRLHGSGYRTIPTGSDAFWPSWGPGGTRIAYSTQLTPTQTSGIYTVALDGSHPQLVASGGAAPSWSPDGRTIAYQTTCGIRLVTPSGSDVTPSATANACGAIGLSGPPVWSPDGTKIAVATSAGVYVMNKSGAALHLVSHQATTTEYGSLPGRPSWRPTRWLGRKLTVAAGGVSASGVTPDRWPLP